MTVIASMHDRTKSNDQRFNTNCVGFTFADGRFWVQPDQIWRILTGDGYGPTTNPKKGDVVLYVNSDEDPIHVARSSDDGTDSGRPGRARYEVGRRPIGTGIAGHNGFSIWTQDGKRKSRDESGGPKR